ncbi:MAG: 6-phosphofructokinase [Anaerolineales bacterium]|nr:6-phosphofructokinase [Anaerolineales bacterium]
MRRIAVMTSGGDAPGMNAAIRAVVRTANAKNIEVYGIRRGYTGLLAGDFERLTNREVSGILQRGGTILQTARNEEFKTERGQKRGLRRLNEQGIDGLVVIGGDGSLQGALALHQEDFPVVGVPGSIDNDIWGTNMSIGTDTALNTLLDAIDKLRDTASSHERAFLLEAMGRNCGYLALMSGILGGAEVVSTPEKPIELEEIAQALDDAYTRGKSHAIAVIAEGAKHRIHEVASYLEKHPCGFEVRVTILGHVQRGGSPSAFDRLLATRLGVHAVDELVAGNGGVMVGLNGRDIVPVQLEEVISQRRMIHESYFEMADVLSR